MAQYGKFFYRGFWVNDNDGEGDSGGAFGGPGEGGNGSGLDGVYYDWFSSTYHSTFSGNLSVSWSYVRSVISNYGATLYSRSCGSELIGIYYGISGGHDGLFSSINVVTTKGFSVYNMTAGGLAYGYSYNGVACKPNSGGGSWLDGTIKWGVDPASNLATARAGLKYTSSNFLRVGYWQGANGKYYPLSLTQKGAQGWRIYEGSANLANKSVKWIGFAGQGLGYLSLLYSGYNVIDNPTLGNKIDFGVSVASVAFWEIGAVYYGGKSLYELTRINTNYLMSNGVNPGMQFIINKE